MNRYLPTITKTLLIGTIGCSLNLSQNLLGENQMPPPANTSGLGSVTGYYCGYGDSSYEIENLMVFHEPGTPVSYEEALEECDLVAWASDASVYCEWNGEPIFLYEVTPGDCDDARFGGEPGDGICSQSPELNVIGSYTARPESGQGPAGDTDIHIERSAPQVLVLSTYEQVHWNITAAPGAQIQKIIVTGYDTPTVNAPPGVPVEIHSLELDNDYILGAPGPFPDSDPFSGATTAVFFDRVEAHTGLEITSYHNCYHLTDLTLHADLSATSNCTNAVDQRPYYDEGDFTPTSYLDPDCGITPNEPGGCEHFCGDGVVNPELGEECDDGNNTNGDGCDASCLVEVGCGDPTPECDGVDLNGDGVIQSEGCPAEECIGIDFDDNGTIDEYDCNDEDYCETIDNNNNGIPDTFVCGSNINEHCSPVDTDGDGLEDLFDCDFD